MEVNLHEMKYSELQKLAKKHGIKANMKYEKLLKALQEFFSEDGSEFFKEENNPEDGAKTKQSGKRKRTQSDVEESQAKRRTFDKVTPKKQSTTSKKNSIKENNNGASLSDKVNQDNARTSLSKRSTKSIDKNTQDNARSSLNKRRTRSIDKNTGKGDGSSPGVKKMIEEMNGEMTDVQMKASLLDALDKRVKQKHNDSASSSEIQVSQIPRYAGSKKAITPGNKDWKEIHKRQFSKMESIDNYLERKKQRTESLTTSMKKMQMLSQQVKNVMESVKKYRTPPSFLKKSTSAVPGKSKMSLFQSPGAKPFQPTVTSVSKANFKFGKSPVPKHFVPTVTSTAKANWNFSARRSPRLSGTSSTKSRPSESKENTQENMANVSVASKSGTTPFRFRGALNKSALLNKSQNTSLTTKAKFDLKASLSKPITWKQHRGKLQPFKTESIYAQTHKKSNNTKEQCRKVIQSKRADKRLDLQMKRRGVQV